MTLLILFAVTSIGFSFLCSILEAALLSVTPSYIASLKSARPALFQRLRDLKDNIDDPLSAILTLNTVAHTVGATGVGAQVTVLYGESWLGVASGGMTLAILIFSEIIPKTIGAKYWKSIAPALPATLRFLIVVLMPFIWLSKQITRRLGDGGIETDIRAEISALTEIGRDQQALDEDERRVIQNTLRLHEIKTSAIMTPRTVSKYFAPASTAGEFREKAVSLPFSRFPLIDEEGGTVGYVHKSDLLCVDDATPLSEIAREAVTVNGTTNIEYLFGEMLVNRQHLAVVYDELGTWIGIVTMEDIIETMLGREIMDETDNVSNLRRYARQRWSRRLKKSHERGGDDNSGKAGAGG
ncbi:MAG: CNNM domain-containing protein [Pseudohongiellaceae bacterium]